MLISMFHLSNLLHSIKLFVILELAGFFKSILSIFTGNIVYLKKEKEWNTRNIKFFEKTAQVTSSRIQIKGIYH